MKTIFPIFDPSIPKSTWILKKDGEDITVHTKPGLIINSVPALTKFILKDMGIGYCFSFEMQDHIKAGLVEPVLPDHNRHFPPLYLYYPTEYRGNIALKTFLANITAQKE